MQNSPRAGRIDRVVVWLDSASEIGMALATAARLAARAKAPLHGVFVEDEDLLRLARLPVMREIAWETGAPRLTPGRMEQEIRLAAEHARQELAAAANRCGLAWSFETVRGGSEGAPPHAATEGDFVVACALTRPIAGAFRLECRWLERVEAVDGAVLLAGHRWDAGGSVVILLRDRGPGSVRLIETVAPIAEAEGGELVVICPPVTAGADGFESWIADRLAGFAVRLQIEVAEPEPEALRARIAALSCRLLAIEAGALGELGEITRWLTCDLLVVR